MTSFYPYGFERMEMGFTDATTGAFIGKAATLTAGASSGAYVQSNVKAAGLAPVSDVTLEIQGGDRIRATVSFQQTKLAPFEISVSDLDPTLVVLINGGSQNTGNDYFTKFHTNSNRIAQTTMLLSLQSPITDEDGNSYYRSIIVPKARCKFVGGGFAFRGISDSLIKVAPQMTTKAHTGQTFGTGANNLAFAAEENKLDHYYYKSTYPIHLFAARRLDAAALNVTADYLPLASTVHATDTPNEFVVAGVPTALTSISITTGAVVIAAGGAGGDYGVLTMETAFVPS